MLLDPDRCYRALKTHDARFDGRLFVGVSSTRIYCRPVCASGRLPRRENCSFYPSAAAAEAAGYRPCLHCRPELAPGNASVDASARLAQAAANFIEDEITNGGNLETLAERLQVSDRHLRRVFQQEFGVAPVDFAQTQRLLLAKRLLTDTRLPVTEVAFASGFRSLRRFNAVFRERYRLCPSALRRTAVARTANDELVFELAYRPPFDWHNLLDFLDERHIPGVEAIAGGTYRRTVALFHHGQLHTGWIEVRRTEKKPTLRVCVSASLVKILPGVLARMKRLFDLSCDPEEIARGLGPLAAPRPGLRLPGAFDGFEIAVRAVLGQQITVRAARTMVSRFVEAFGERFETPFPALEWLFPAAQRVANVSPSAIAALGIVGARARAVVAIANAVTAGSLRLELGGDVANTIEQLKTVPSVGEWTAQYIAMRALAWPDAFPHTDCGVMKALGETNPRRVLERAEAWRPWRAYAAMYLWMDNATPV